MKCRFERGWRGEELQTVLFILTLLRGFLSYNIFSTVALHGMALVLAEHPEERERLLDALMKQTEAYEESLRKAREKKGI